MADVVDERRTGSPQWLVRAALAHAMLRGGRQVSLGPGGASFVDHFGERVDFLPPGSPVLRGVSNHLRDALHAGRGFHVGPDDALDFGRLGTWHLTELDGTCVLKAKRPGPPCVEAVCGDGATLAPLRSLYRAADVEVYVFCDGATRARDFALALAAERHGLGLRTHLDVSRVTDETRFHATDPVPFDGSSPFASADDTPSWFVEQVPYEEAMRAFSGPPRRVGARAGASVTLCALPRHVRWTATIRRGAESSARPVAAVTVTVEKSEPVVAVSCSPSALALASREAHADAPWDRYAERLSARRASRPARPRTWHPTSEAVARAYFEGRAPRGFVSGRSLFFHGPVAFSLWTGNPVAAFVEAADGVPTLVYGRDPGVGGTKAAVVSMAIGDLERAADPTLRVIHLGDLTQVLAWGGRPLDDVARRVGARKGEASLPKRCTVDPGGLSTWLVEARDAGSAEVERTQRSGMATFARADAYRRMASLAAKRESLEAALGVDLPDVGSYAHYRASYLEARQGAVARKADLDARREARTDEIDGVPNEDEEGHVMRM